MRGCCEEAGRGYLSGLSGQKDSKGGERGVTFPRRSIWEKPVDVALPSIFHLYISQVVNWRLLFVGLSLFHRAGGNQTIQPTLKINILSFKLLCYTSHNQQSAMATYSSNVCDTVRVHLQSILHCVCGSVRLDLCYCPGTLKGFKSNQSLLFWLCNSKIAARSTGVHMNGTSNCEFTKEKKN